MATAAPPGGGRRRAFRRRARYRVRPPVSGGERAPQLDDDAAVRLERSRLRACPVHVGGDQSGALLLGPGRATREGAAARDPLAPDRARGPLRPRLPPP